MAYDKYTWQTGEVITQEKLNHMEQGIEDAYELPAVSDSDNGKVLGVEDGAWSLVNGGGGGMLVVNMTMVDSGESNTANQLRGVVQPCYVLDKTWQEIYDAFMAGTTVILKHEFGADVGVGLLPEVGHNGSGYFVGSGLSQFNTDSPSGYPTMCPQ